ncbi:type II toxin-antitoxin system RelE/ParE family toxin [Pseudoduganella sp. OTU4001]|uniref:type II toxin-antitoxin system RelE/ParE family toxin n=1 Tax=Pseudoduganella sp. OTU4001 TaxID=3043854 RepID=UPI00313C3D6F
MLPIRWSQSAEDDVRSIVEYLSERSESAALRMLETLDRCVDRLSRQPDLYRAGRVAGTREMVFHPSYCIVYRVHAHEIEIVSVLHTRRSV